MAKFFSLVLVLSMSLAPGVAFAGAVVGCDKVAPTWNATTGSSGAWFYNASTGESDGADLDSGVETGSGALPDLIGGIGGGYSLLGDATIGYPDLNGDGITDVVMVHTTGFTYGYILEDDGSGWLTVAEQGELPKLITTDYKWVGLPDLNGDGKTDLCEIHTSGFTYCFLMDGLTATGNGQIPGPIDANYVIIGFPDMDGLNGSDVVVQHTSGFTYTFTLESDGGDFIQKIAGEQGATGSLIDSNFETIGFPDLNGDNRSDIVIQHTNGFTFAFLQNGKDLIDKGSINGLIDSNYSTLGFPDMNGDGFSDHVMRHTGGFTYAFLQEPDAGTFLQLQAAGQVQGPNPNYELRGFPDLDCDGAADVTYQHTGGFTIAHLAGSSGFNDTSTQVTTADGFTSPPAGSVTRDWARSWALIPDPFAP